MKKLILLVACTALFTACNQETETGVGGEGTTTTPGTGSPGGAGTSSGTMRDTGTPNITTNEPGALTNQMGTATNNPDALTPPPVPQPNPNQDAGADQP
jgi:hypothetical protein